MTSTYNLTRRKNDDTEINWDASHKQFGVCKPGDITVPIFPNGNCSDWKICVPLKNEEGLPISYPVIKKGTQRVKRRTFTNNLYDNDLTVEQSKTNYYPVHSRRPPNRAELDYKDYFRLPIKYDGTGYFPTRTWSYPEHSLDTVEQLPKEWSKFHLIQRHDMQQHAIDELLERKMKGMKDFEHPYKGYLYRN